MKKMDDEKILNLAGVIKSSIVDGPGIRDVLFFQGCPHNCRNCHNKETHEFKEKYLYKINDLISIVSKDNPKKLITISGGEPFCQIKGLLNLTKKLNKLYYNIIIYTGYTFEELIILNNDALEILNNIDTLIDGKFMYEQKDLSLKFCGSRNQRIIDSKNSIKNKKIILKNL